MPGGDESEYADKQKRQAEHIEEGREERGFMGAAELAKKAIDAGKSVKEVVDEEAE